MRQLNRHPMWIVIVIVGGGTLVIALTWLLYLGIYLAIETLFFAKTPLQVPVSQIRMGTALGLSLLGVLLMRSKANAILKALLIMSPISMVLVTLIFRVYAQPLSIVMIVAGYTGALLLGIRFAKLPWFYGVAVGTSVILSTLYAWPR